MAKSLGKGQWMVVTDGYERTFQKEGEARKTYNSIATEIEEDESGGIVELMFRNDISSEWVIAERFACDSDEEEEEEEYEEDEDDDDDDDDEEEEEEEEEEDEA